MSLEIKSLVLDSSDLNSLRTEFLTKNETSDDSTELIRSVSECNESGPRLKSAKNRVQLSAGLNLGSLNTTIFKPQLKFKPPLKFFKFCLCFRINL